MKVLRADIFTTFDWRKEINSCWKNLLIGRGAVVIRTEHFTRKYSAHIILFAELSWLPMTIKLTGIF